MKRLMSIVLAGLVGLLKEASILNGHGGPVSKGRQASDIIIIETVGTLSIEYLERAEGLSIQGQGHTQNGPGHKTGFHFAIPAGIPDDVTDTSHLAGGNHPAGQTLVPP